MYLPALPAVPEQISLSLSVRLVLQGIEGDLVASSTALMVITRHDFQGSGSWQRTNLSI